MSERGAVGARFIRNLERAAERRRKNPHLFVSAESDFLYVENVSEKLGCSIDQARRIPASELPRAKVGKRSVYLRQDVVDYVKRNREGGAPTAVPHKTPTKARGRQTTSIADGPAKYAKSLRDRK